MTPPTGTFPATGKRQFAVESIDRVISRLPMVVRVLGELRESTVPLPGDTDMRHGCDRALTGMMSGLARISPAPAGPALAGELSIRKRLADPETRSLVDADQLQRMVQLIDSILNQE